MARKGSGMREHGSVDDREGKWARGWGCGNEHQTSALNVSIFSICK